MVLEDAGYAVEEAEDGEQGAAAFREAPFDILIIDMIMPGRGGAEIIMDLWRDFPSIKVIAISGGDAAASPAELLEYAGIFGAMRTFKKPVGAQHLLDAVRELLKEA